MGTFFVNVETKPRGFVSTKSNFVHKGSPEFVEENDQSGSCFGMKAKRMKRKIRIKKGNPEKNRVAIKNTV
jgi:hypothetical protein